MSTEESSTKATPAAKTESKSKSKPIPRPADYGLPPDGWRQSNHYYHYGWPVSQKTLRSTLLKLPLKLPNHNEYAGSLCARLGLLLKFEGINAILCKADEFCESQGRAFTCEGERNVQFISIGCTCSRKYFWRRPDQETMEVLIKIMGEEPRWMENASTKKEFAIGLLA